MYSLSIGFPCPDGRPRSFCTCTDDQSLQTFRARRTSSTTLGTPQDWPSPQTPRVCNRDINTGNCVLSSICGVSVRLKSSSTEGLFVKDQFELVVIACGTFPELKESAIQGRVLKPMLMPTTRFEPLIPSILEKEWSAGMPRNPDMVRVPSCIAGT
jgi:hypothetical protein